MKIYNLTQIAEAKKVMRSKYANYEHIAKRCQPILRWHETYLKFVRLMHKHMKSFVNPKSGLNSGWDLATKAVWQMIRRTKKKSIFSLYRSFVHSLLSPKNWQQDSTEYVKTSFTEVLHGKSVNVKLSQKCRAEKSRFRMRCMNITNNMQTI
jgi:hypothetical protein